MQQVLSQYFKLSEILLLLTLTLPPPLAPLLLELLAPLLLELLSSQLFELLPLLLLEPLTLLLLELLALLQPGPLMLHIVSAT